MSPILKKLSFLVLVSMLAACGSREVTIAPNVVTLPSSIGNGHTVSLQVVDDRDMPDPGEVTNIREYTSADSKKDQELLSLIGKELETGLARKGFMVSAPGEPSDSTVMANLRGFRALHEKRLLSNVSNATVAIRIEAQKDGREFRKVFRSANYQGVYKRAGSKLLGEKLSDGLSIVLEYILADEELMAFLTS